MTTKEACINIWRECFGDSEEFIDLYFSRRYTDDCTFVSRAEGRIVAASQCFIYEMTGGIKVGYVSGLATMPEYRGQGHARLVMQQMHQWLRLQGIAYCTLIPSGPYAAQWYHKQFGYNYGIRNDKYIVTPEFLSHYTLEHTLTPDALQLITADMNRRPYYILHSPDDLTDQLNTCILSGGGLYTSRAVSGELQEAFFVEYHDQQPVMLDYFNLTPSLAPGNSPTIPPSTPFDSPISGQAMWVALCDTPPLPPTARLSLMLD